MEEFRCLVLDQSYLPIKVIGVYRAFVLHYFKNAELVKAHDNLTIAGRSVPSIIRINKSLSRLRFKIRPSSQNIYERDNRTCQYCGKKMKKDESTLDHVIPKSKGGPFSFTNLVASCYSCNQFKADREPNEAGMSLLREPFTPLPFCKGSTPKEWEDFLIS